MRTAKKKVPPGRETCRAAKEFRRWNNMRDAGY